MPHTIRLRGPWNLRHGTLETPESFRAPGPAPLQAIAERISQARLSHGNVDGQQHVELVRTFNRPTGLESSSVVSLCGRIVTSGLAVEVNHKELLRQNGGEFRVDVTPVLKDSNVVVIRCPVILPTEAGVTPLAIDEVWLEIL